MPRGERKPWSEEALEKAYGMTQEFLAGSISLKDLKGQFRGRSMSTVLMAAVRRREQVNQAAAGKAAPGGKGGE